MDIKKAIAALGVLVDPNASDEDKAAAADQLTAFFNEMLDAQVEEENAEAEREAAAEAARAEEEKAAADRAEEEKAAAEKAADEAAESKKELDSAIAQIKALTERVAQMEKASSVGNAPRAKVPTVIPRTDPAMPKDFVIQAIEVAERNTLKNMSK